MTATLLEAESGGTAVKGFRIEMMEGTQEYLAYRAYVWHDESK
jgi:hypothetical protein